VQPAELDGVEPVHREAEDALLVIAGPMVTWRNGHAQNPVTFLLVASQGSTPRSQGPAGLASLPLTA
jgi:hypothetical protein